MINESEHSQDNPQSTPIAQPMTEHNSLQSYLSLSHETLAVAALLPKETIAERYQILVRQKYAQMNNHRAIFETVFRVGLDANREDFAQLSGHNDPMYQAIAICVDNANDTPNHATRDAFVNVMYVFYLLMMLFRLYDHTPRHQASDHLLKFIHDAFKLVRPMMVMPMFANAMRKLSAILLLVFGGRVYETEPTPPENA